MGSLRVMVVMFAVGCNTTGGDIVAPGSDEDPNLAPAQHVGARLDQTVDSEIAKNMSVACSDGTGTTENSWYRVFSLEQYKIDNPFTVSRVNFGVQNVVGDQRVKVSIGTFAGTMGTEQFDTSQIDVLALTTIPVTEAATGQIVQANFPDVVVPAGSNLVVEVRTEGHSATNGTDFYLGATKGDETSPGYLRAPICNTATPTMTNALGYVSSHLIIAVSGTH